MEETSGMKRHLYPWVCVWLAILVAGFTTGCRSEADRVAGTWQGVLDVGTAFPQRVKPGTTLRVVCNIRKQSGGTLTGTLDSPDQRATGIAIDTVTIKDGLVHLQINQIFASFDGQLSKDGREIPGQWKQGPVSLPLVFKKIS
jgi:hypothetical protein